MEKDDETKDTNTQNFHLENCYETHGITKEEYCIIKCLREIPEEESNQLRWQIRRAYTMNKLQIEIHSVHMDEPYDYSQCDFYKRYLQIMEERKKHS